MNNTSLAFKSFQEEVSTNEDELQSNKCSASTILNFRKLKSPISVDFRSCKSETDSPLNTVEIRKANRAIRVQIPESEYRSLLSERHALVEKKFTVGLTEKEEFRLKMLRWRIDGIEDAMFGNQLDELEAFAEKQEKLAKSVNEFVTNLNKGFNKKR